MKFYWIGVVLVSLGTLLMSQDFGLALILGGIGALVGAFFTALGKM